MHAVLVHPKSRRKSRRHATSRAALLTAAAVFMAVQLGSAIAIDQWLPEYRDPEYGCRLQILRARLASAATPPLTVVMLGSSRTANGFDARVVNAELSRVSRQPIVCVNFGITGGGPLVELLTLRRLLSQGIHPDLVLIEVLPSVFQAEHSGAEAVRVSSERVWKRDLPVVLRYGARADLVQAWWRDEAVPFFSHRFAILSQLAPTLLPHELRIDWIFALERTDGWLQLPRAWSLDRGLRQRALARARADYQPTVSQLHPNGLSCQTLRDLLGLCRRKQLAAVLVLMPEGPAFRSWYSAKSWSQFQRFLSDVSRAYQAPVINAREWIGEEDFLDSHHLFPSGAATFSRCLASEVIPLLFSNHDPADLLASGHGSPARAGDGDALR